MRKVGLVILTLCTAFLSINIAEAVEDSPSSRATLKGLPGLSVGVPRLSGCESAGAYGPAIQAKVEFQLRQAGVKALKTGQGLAVLRIILSCFPVRSISATAFLNIVRVDQAIPWPSSSTPSVVVTWHSEIGLGIGPKTEISKALRKEIQKRVDQFIEAWLSVNPK